MDRTDTEPPVASSGPTTGESKSDRVEAKEPEAGKSLGKCVICMESPSSMAFIHGASAHLCCCKVCLEELRWRTGGLWNDQKCPVCRQTYTAVVEVFIG